MFDMSSDLGFQTLCNLGLYILFAIAQRSARPWSHGYVPLGIPTHVFRSLLNALVACIGKDTFLFAVQQIVRLSNCRLPDDYERLYQRIEAYSHTTRT